MQVNSINHSTFSTPETMLPTGGRNYCLFNWDNVNFFASQKEAAIPYLKDSFVDANKTKDEKQVLELLCITDKLLDNKTKGMEKLYPYLAKFNDTKSPNIQTYLAGVYRKMQVPDAFGPLISMLVKNIIEPKEQQNFDPNEEIGGAILSYIENYSKGRKLNIDA